MTAQSMPLQVAGCMADARHARKEGGGVSSLPSILTGAVAVRPAALGVAWVLVGRTNGDE